MSQIKASVSRQEMLTELFAALPEDPYEYMSGTLLCLPRHSCGLFLPYQGHTTWHLVALFDRPRSKQRQQKRAQVESLVKDQKLVSSGVLWALLPGGDPMHRARCD